ncbi:MAG: monovalent cation/H+ antiporter complex subunit F [Planctomycetota bacterium]
MGLQLSLAASDANTFESFARSVLFGVVNLGIVVLFVCLVLAQMRLLRGPTLVDRGVATDLVAVLIAGMAILFTIRLETLMMFDAVLIVSILGFVSTIAFAQYIGRRGKAA